MRENEIINSKVIAITGGIGSGKTTVSAIIRDSGYIVLDTDAMAKDLMGSNDELKESLQREFGEEIYEKGSLNREFLASIVFGSEKDSEEKLDKLNQIVHPFVIEEMYNRCEELAEEGEDLIFIESALIYEAGLEDGFDYVVVVDASEELCLERVMKRSSMSSEQIKNRIDSQFSVEHKKSQADFVIDNSGSLEKLRSSVEFVLSVLEELPPREPEN